jgi:lipid-A-disaccharide synthase
MEAGQIISRSIPAANFIIPVAPSIDMEDIEGRAARWSFPVRIVQNDTYSVINACDLVLTASGTVTLETAIIGTPMIIFYKVSKLNEVIGRLLIRTQFIGLPNLISGKAIAPEFVQESATGPRLAECAIRLLKDPSLLDEQRSEFMRVREMLGAPGISSRIARLVLETAGVAM